MLKHPSKTKDAVVAWIRDYFEKNLPEALAVIGISGGKDSSAAAALCAEALGRERVLGVLMPDGQQADIADSRALVAQLGIPSMEINIHPMTEAFEESLGFAPKGEAKINLPPRVRMTTLYAVAQSQPSGGLVINTCNASEDYVGYSTKFGDAAGDLSPLSAFTVEEVLQLGEALGLPTALVHKTPSDGLSGRSDEDKLGFSYHLLDRYLATGVCEDAAAKEKIDRLHRRNLHKLLPMPHYEARKEERT